MDLPNGRMYIFRMRWDSDDLLLTLHEGMFQEPLWRDFLEKLRVRSKALYTTLIFRTADRDTAIELFAGQIPPAHIVSLFTEKYAHDPFAYRHRHEGRVYSLEELIDPGNPVHHAFHAELLVPQGMTSLRSVRVTEPGSFDAWLGCAGGDGMGSPASALLSALVPHLRAALRSFVAFERERFRASITSEAFGRLNVGWLTLDAQCRIIDSDEHDEIQAQQITERPDGALELDARTPVEAFEQRVGQVLTDEERAADIDTVGGLVFTLAGRVPKKGELVSHPGSGLEFRVLESDPRRIRRLRVRRPLVDNPADTRQAAE